MGVSASIALIHYPVYNKNREVIAASVTNLDVHDIARTAATFGLKRYYIVTPLKAQQEIVRRMLRHWIHGYGSEFNPFRKSALTRISVVDSVQDVLIELVEAVGRRPKLVATMARDDPRSVSYRQLRGLMSEAEGGDHFLVMFGTGWGIADELVKDADYILTPVKGPSDYNHLSVRSAAAIVLDRLFGERIEAAAEREGARSSSS